MSKATPRNLNVPAVFPQTAISIGDVQVISSTDELFNHVDDNLPMWAEDGDRLVSLDTADSSVKLQVGRDKNLWS
jgi:hypothetical protein